MNGPYTKPFIIVVTIAYEGNCYKFDARLQSDDDCSGETGINFTYLMQQNNITVSNTDMHKLYLANGHLNSQHVKHYDLFT